MYKGHTELKYFFIYSRW